MTDKLITKIEEIPLSGDDLIDIANCLNVKRVKHMLYDDLVNFESLDALFGDSIDAIYILLQIKNQETKTSSVGHWVCFINHRDQNEYYWFDPYGLQIAQELSLTHEPATILNLTKGVKIDQNDIQHQKFSSEVNTCGRHCVVRSVFYHLDNQEYNKLVVKPIVPVPIKEADSLVALLTGLASKSDEHLIAFFNKKERKREQINPRGHLVPQELRQGDLGRGGHLQINPRQHLRAPEHRGHEDQIHPRNHLFPQDHR